MHRADVKSYSRDCKRGTQPMGQLMDGATVAFAVVPEQLLWKSAVALTTPVAAVAIVRADAIKATVVSSRCRVLQS